MEREGEREGDEADISVDLTWKLVYGKRKLCNN